MYFKINYVIIKETHTSHQNQLIYNIQALMNTFFLSYDKQEIVIGMISFCLTNKRFTSLQQVIHVSV